MSNGAAPLILHVRLVTGSGGGPDKTVLNSPRHLRRLGYDCICAYMHPPADPGFQMLRDRARQWQAPLLSVPDRGRWDWKVLFDLVRICRERRVAVWHAHEYKSNLFGVLARRFWPMKLVTTVHGWVRHTKRTPLYYAMDRWALRYYEQVVCVSEDLQEQCLALGIPPDRCSLIHNAIDTEEFQRRHSSAEAKRLLGAPAGSVLVGALGRLSDEKGFNLLIQAVARLVRQGRDLHLWIAGEGGQRAALESAIAREGLAERVRLLGVISDPRTFLEAADLFVLSSVREGLPNVILEAMAMKTPVVATRIAGVPGLLDEGRLGVLVEPGSVDALVAGIEAALDEPNAGNERVALSRRTIEEAYSFDRRMQRMAALYDRVLGRGSEELPTPQLQTA